MVSLDELARCGFGLSDSEPAAVFFLSSTSLGNRSWIVFQRTVLTLQYLPLLRNIEYYDIFIENEKCTRLGNNNVCHI